MEPNTSHPQIHIQPAPPYQPPHPPVHPLSIVGLVLAFVVPPAGLIISIIVLAKKLQGSNTVLGILGVVFGALNSLFFLMIAAMTMTTFVGIQERSKDTATQTTAHAMQNQVEAYYAETGSYPTPEQIRDMPWLEHNFTANSDEVGDDFLADSRITYQVTPNTCQNTASSPCEEYTFTLALRKGPQQLKSETLDPGYYEDDAAPSE